MKKKDKFIALVQTYVIAIANPKEDDQGREGKVAISILADAMEISEEDIPDNVEEACLEFVTYMNRNHPNSKRPSWWKK